MSNDRMVTAAGEGAEGRPWVFGRLLACVLVAVVVIATSVPETAVAAEDEREGKGEILQVRIAARLLLGGSFEFALQQRIEGTWGIRQLPARRFVRADAAPGRWFASSPLAPAAVQVRIAARILDGNSIELALQRWQEGSWGPLQLPASRLIPADAAPGRWLTSSPVWPAGGTAGPSQPEWTLLAGGDVLMDRTEPAGIDPFAGIEPPLASGDIALVNVEMAISDRGAPIGKQFAFRAPSSAAQRIGDAGIDVANLANNHAKDYGAVALADTIASLEAAGVVALGAGANDVEAFRHRVLEVDGGVTVAFVGVSRIVPWSFPAGPDTPGIATDTEPERVLESVRTAAAEADVVIAVVHWGIEVATCASAEQRAFAGDLFDAGADAVIGHHPHVLQAIEFDDGRLVAYSLGNFVWHPRRGISGETGVLQIDFVGDRIIGWEFHPHLLDENGAPRPADGGWRVGRLRDLIEGECERYEGTTPYDLTPVGDTSDAATQPVAEMRHFSPQQFKELLDSVRLPNLSDIAEVPAITDDAQTDERIREIAEDRGYRLQPVVASLDELVRVEQQLLQPEAARAYEALRAAAQGAGHPLTLASAYRSFATQRHILFRHLKAPYTDERIHAKLRIVAPPGYSRHQTGYAVDLASGDYGINEFRFSGAYAWLAADNFREAKRHGFVPSYPAGVQNQGPDPEPWEFFYVGTDHLTAPP